MTHIDPICYNEKEFSVMLNSFLFYSRVENLIRGEKLIYGARLPE